jgi:hypothetical protein
VIDLANTRVLVVVWAMPGCGACDEYMPVFTERVAAAQANGAPFKLCPPSKTVAPGEIPVLFYDAASENEELQDFADKLGVTATPTTCMMTRYGTTKIEGAIPPGEIDKLLYAAHRANR